MPLARIVVVVVVACCAALLWARPQGAAFAAIAPGVERSSSVVDGVSVLAWRIDLKKRQLRVLPATSPDGKQTVAEIVAPHKDVVVAVNASFFDERGAPMGIVVDEGGRHGSARNEWGAFVVDQTGAARLLPGSQAATAAAAARALVQGVPRLLVDGAVVHGLKPQSFVRTAVCAEGSSVVIVVSRGLVEASAFAAHLRDQLGCRFALNLDGGPSTQVHVRGVDRADDVDIVGQPVPNALVVR